MKPTVGRIVLFIHEPHDGQTESAAIITKIHNDSAVNLTVFFSGFISYRDSVILGTKEGCWRWPDVTDSVSKK